MVQNNYLEINNLRKSYGGRRIIEDITIHAEQGTFLALLGASGCGKTTILRCLAGLEVPDSDSGTISVGGKVVSGPGVDAIPAEHRGMGMVFQNYAVWPHLNVFENVTFPLRLRKPRLDVHSIQARVGKTLELVRLSGLEHRFAHELSGGQQQRVALARALVMEPTVLLLDEPLSNLDANLRESLGSEIRRLQQELRLTTILVTHDQKEAMSLADRVILLDGGRIEAEGTPENLYQRPPTTMAATFLAGGQLLRHTDDRTSLYLPRRWFAVGESGSSKGEIHQLTIKSRLFLGSEYEYLAESSHLKDPVRFYSTKRYPMDQSPVSMRYEA